MSARTDERRSCLYRRACQMDGIGPSLHLLQILESQYANSIPKRKTLGQSEMFFDDFHGLREYLRRTFKVGDSDLMHYVFALKQIGGPHAFDAPAARGPRVVAIYMKDGTYGVADGPTIIEALNSLGNVMRFMDC